MNPTLLQKYDAVKNTLHFSSARLDDHFQVLKWQIAQEVFRFTRIQGLNYKNPHPFERLKASIKWFFGE